MKKWQKITLVILGLGVLGGGATPFRPVIQGDSADRELAPATQSVSLEDTREMTSDFAVDYEWNFHAHPSRTLLVQDLSPDVFSLLKEATWKIRLEVQDGKLVIRSDAPELHARESLQRVEASYSYNMLPTMHIMRPDGTHHPLRALRLGCEVRLYKPGWGKPLRTFAFQEIVLDLIDGTADLVHPTYLRILSLGMDSRVIVSQEETGLPTLLCGSSCEQDLTRILLHLSSIDSRKRAVNIMQTLPEKVKETVATYADDKKNWPDCWGDEAETARRIARRIVPALLRFEETNCYNYQPLADFINSPDFSRVFGESFADAPLPNETRGSIPFERMDEAEISEEQSLSDSPTEK